eukprot:COSAG05_NODE_2024_length_3677_cov_2.848239_5_plen_464_part_00
MVPVLPVRVQVWDDWGGGMRMEKKNHRIEFPMRLDLRPYTAEAVRARHIASIKAELAAQQAAAGKPDGDASETEDDGTGAATAAAEVTGAVAPPPSADAEAATEEEVDTSPIWYDFQGAIIHSGVAGGGHYVSIVKQPDGRFVLFDDNEAIPFDPAKIPDFCFGGTADPAAAAGGQKGRERTKNAYTLFYRKAPGDCGGGRRMSMPPPVLGADSEPEPEPEQLTQAAAKTTEGKEAGGQQLAAGAVGALLEMEKDCATERLRLLRRERLYQPAVMTMVYDFVQVRLPASRNVRSVVRCLSLSCYLAILLLSRCLATSCATLTLTTCLITTAQHFASMEDADPGALAESALTPRVTALACVFFLKVIVRAKHGHASIKKWLGTISALVQVRNTPSLSPLFCPCVKQGSWNTYGNRQGSSALVGRDSMGGTLWERLYGRDSMGETQWERLYGLPCHTQSMVWHGL